MPNGAVWPMMAGMSGQPVDLAKTAFLHLWLVAAAGAAPAQTPVAAFDAASARLAAAAPDDRAKAAALAIEAFLRLPACAERDARLVAGANAAAAADRFDLALQWVGEARRLGPPTHELVELHLRALVRAGRFAGFVDQARADLAGGWQDAAMAVMVAEEARLLPLADLALRRGDAARGRFVFESLAAAAPDDAVRAANLALCLRNLGELAAAEKCYRRARELAPTDPQIENDWGLFLRATGGRGLAVEAFQRSLALDTAVPGGRAGQGPGITNLLHDAALRPGGPAGDVMPAALAALAVRPDAAMLRRLVLDVGLDRAVGRDRPVRDSGPTR